jgi:hypothetical protein
MIYNSWYIWGKYYFGINNLFSLNRKFLMVFTPKFVPDANITSPAEPQVDPGDSAWHKQKVEKLIC